VTVYPLEAVEHCTVGRFPAHTQQIAVLPDVEGACIHDYMHTCIHAYMTTCMHGTTRRESEGFLFHGASDAVGGTTL
jgi:hypothetical protein